MDAERLKLIRITGWALLLLAAGLLLGMWADSPDRPAPPAGLPELGELPAFALVDQDSSAFTRADLAGRVWLANSFFTSCATVCPRLTANMAGLQERTAGLGGEIGLLSVSVDPARDTPSRLAGYAEGYGADPSRWVFLTGPEDEARALVRDGFRLAVQQVDGELPGVYDVVHAEKTVLVDRDGSIRGYYDSDPASLDRLVEDARALAAGGS